MKKTRTDKIAFLVIISIIFGGLLYYAYFLTPKNSLELYQELHFSSDFAEAQKLVLEGYENSFSEEDFDYIKENEPHSIGQFTLFEYNQKAYLIMTTPGTGKLKVLAVEELPEETRMFFSELER